MLKSLKKGNQLEHENNNRKWIKLDVFAITSTIETRTADIIANEWPAAKVGGPHCKGYGNLNLKIMLYNYFT